MDRRRHVLHAVHYALSIGGALSCVLNICPRGNGEHGHRRFRTRTWHRRRHRLLHGLPRAILTILLLGYNRQPVRIHRGSGVHRQRVGDVRRSLGHEDHVLGLMNLACRLTRLDPGYSP